MTFAAWLLFVQTAKLPSLPEDPGPCRLPVSFLTGNNNSGTGSPPPPGGMGTASQSPGGLNLVTERELSYVERSAKAPR